MGLVAEKTDKNRGDVATPGAFFLWRPEVNEATFIREHGAHVHGAVLLGRHLVRRPDDPPSTDLARAAREVGCPHLHDPDTAILIWHEGTGEERFGRSGEMPAARLVDLPLRPEALAGDAQLEQFVRLTLASQIGTTHVAPPYFRFSGVDDPWLQLSLRAAAVANKVSAPRPLAVFVSTDLDGLTSGALAAAAPLYARVLQGDALVFLSVAGLDSLAAEPKTLAAYLGAVGAFTAAGFRVIADRVGRFGAAVVASGAAGYCAGTRVYRHTPPSPDWKNERSIKVLMHYEAPGRGDRIRRQDVARRLRRKSIPACPVPDCPVGERVTVKDMRWHSIHLQQLEVGEAAELGLEGWAKQLAVSPRNYVRGWAEALRLSAQASQAA
jgi:hypothetical protein